MNNIQEFIEYVLYLGNHCPNLTLTKLYKLLWFANLAYADKHGGVMIRDIFLKQKYGPVPEIGKSYIETVRSSLGQEDENIKVSITMINGYEHIYILPKRESNMEYLSEVDVEILDQIIENYGTMNASELSKLSHDVAWESVDLYERVDITKDMKKTEYKGIVGDIYDDISFLTGARMYA